MSFKPMMKFGPFESKGNALVFETYAEAEASAKDLFSRWTMPTGFEVAEVNDAVNYKWDDVEGNVPLSKGELK